MLVGVAVGFQLAHELQELDKTPMSDTLESKD